MKRPNQKLGVAIGLAVMMAGVVLLGWLSRGCVDQWTGMKPTPTPVPVPTWCVSATETETPEPATETPTASPTPTSQATEEAKCVENGHDWPLYWALYPILSENHGELWWGFEENLRRGLLRTTGRVVVQRCARCGLWREKP